MCLFSTCFFDIPLCYRTNVFASSRLDPFPTPMVHATGRGSLRPPPQELLLSRPQGGMLCGGNGRPISPPDTGPVKGTPDTQLSPALSEYIRPAHVASVLRRKKKGPLQLSPAQDLMGVLFRGFALQRLHSKRALLLCLETGSEPGRACSFTPVAITPIIYRCINSTPDEPPKASLTIQTKAPWCRLWFWPSWAQWCKLSSPIASNS